MFVATLNRTPKSFALAIVGAEYVLRWLPRGTHDWRKFVRPSELAAAARRASTISEPDRRDIRSAAGSWGLSRDLEVNYMATVTRAAA